MTVRHLLEIDDLSPAELDEVLRRAVEPPPVVPPLAGRTVGLYFEKPSLRTRHSCEVAVVQLGGHPVTFRRDEVGSGEREPVGDIARVLSGYHAALGGRVYDHALLEELATAATVPVVNLLSDRGHPCQALADLLTMRLGAEPVVSARPQEAVAGAGMVHTDVWASMGQESEAEQRLRAFEGFQVDDRVMAAAAPDAVFMHCLPAHRGEEVAASVVDGPQSRVIAQAHNRLHSFRGLLAWLIEEAEQ